MFITLSGKVGYSDSAIQRIGPIMVLVCGAWLISIVGPKTIFILLGIPTALSILIALKLPKLNPLVSRSKWGVKNDHVYVKNAN